MAEARRRQRHHLAVAIHPPEHPQHREKERRWNDQAESFDQLEPDHDHQHIGADRPAGGLAEIADDHVGKQDQRQDQQHHRECLEDLLEKKAVNYPHGGFFTLPIRYTSAKQTEPYRQRLLRESAGRCESNT